jgi:hypothetical protein
MHCIRETYAMLIVHRTGLKAKPHLWLDSRLVGAPPGVPPSVRCALVGRALSECRPSVVTLGGALMPGIGSRSRFPVQNAESRIMSTSVVTTCIFGMNASSRQVRTHLHRHCSPLDAFLSSLVSLAGAAGSSSCKYQRAFVSSRL